MPVRGLRNFPSHHPFLTSVSLGDIRPEVDEDGGTPIEMMHLTNVVFTSRLIGLDLHSTLRSLRFGAFGPMETLIIRREVKGRGDRSAHLTLNVTYHVRSTKKRRTFSRCGTRFARQGITAVEFKRPHVRSATSEPFIPLFENSLQHLRTVRMAWGKTTAEEAEYSKLQGEPLPDIGRAASYLVPILRCRAAVGKPVHLIERLVEDDEDPADSRLNDLLWEQYLCRAFNFQKYLK